MTTIQGLKIAYISGTYDRDVYSATMDSGSPSATHVHYTNGSVRSLCSVPPAPPHVRQGVDILLTVEWPEGIAEGSAVVSKLPKGTDATGIKPIAEIAAALQPRYHFAAEPGVFFQREPYNNRGGAEHVTWFISLGSFGAPNKQRVSPLRPGVHQSPLLIYAFSVVLCDEYCSIISNRSRAAFIKANKHDAMPLVLWLYKGWRVTEAAAGRGKEEHFIGVLCIIVADFVTDTR